MNTSEVNRIVDNILATPTKEEKLKALMIIRHIYSTQDALQITTALKVRLGISELN